MRARINEELNAMELAVHQNNDLLSNEMVKRRLIFCNVKYYEFAARLGISTFMLTQLLNPQFDIRKAIVAVLDKVEVESIKRTKKKPGYRSRCTAWNNYRPNTRGFKYVPAVKAIADGD